MKKQWQPHFLGLLMVLVISQTLFAQQNKMKLVSSIQTIEEIFGLVYPGNQTGVHMTMSGMVEEWDSTFHFTMRYDLREIDLSMAEIVQDEQAWNCILTCFASNSKIASSLQRKAGNQAIIAAHKLLLCLLRRSEN